MNRHQRRAARARGERLAPGTTFKPIGDTYVQTSAMLTTNTVARSEPTPSQSDIVAQIEGSMAVLADYRAAEERREQMLTEFARIGYGPDSLVLDVIPGGRK